MNHKHITKAFLLFFGIALFALSCIIPVGASAATLSGYAWSETIGWISFTPATNGGNTINIDASGNVSGYGWSENIGWVKFGELSNIPSGGADAKITGSSFTGWARACAGTVTGDCNGSSRTDGWDGWISLSGTSPDYGVTLNPVTGVFDGYAWGSEVVGWLDFSYATTDAQPVVNGDCSTTPTQCDAGDPTNIDDDGDPITWTCEGSGFGHTNESCPASSGGGVCPDVRVETVVTPTFVDAPGNTCTLTWTTNQLGSSTDLLCEPGDIVCFLNGVQVSGSASIPIGTHDFRCRYDGGSTDFLPTSRPRCQLNPDYGEF